MSDRGTFVSKALVSLRLLRADPGNSINQRAIHCRDGALMPFKLGRCDAREGESVTKVSVRREDESVSRGTRGTSKARTPGVSAHKATLRRVGLLDGVWNVARLLAREDRARNLVGTVQKHQPCGESAANRDLRFLRDRIHRDGCVACRSARLRCTIAPCNPETRNCERQGNLQHKNLIR